MAEGRQVVWLETVWRNDFGDTGYVRLRDWTPEDVAKRGLI